MCGPVAIPYNSPVGGVHLQSFVSKFPLKTVIPYSFCTPALTDNYTYTVGAQQQNNYILPSPGGLTERWPYTFSTATGLCSATCI